MDKLTIGGREFSSRLFVGTGKFSSNDAMLDAILESGSEMITVAMKRLDTSDAASDDMLKHINREHVQFLPNTSGGATPTRRCWRLSCRATASAQTS